MDDSESYENQKPNPFLTRLKLRESIRQVRRPRILEERDGGRSNLWKARHRIEGNGWEPGTEEVEV